MTKRMRGLAAVTTCGLLFLAGAANALPSIDMIWDTNQSSVIGTPTVAVGSTLVADIVLRGSGKNDGQSPRVKLGCLPTLYQCTKSAVPYMMPP